jgi:hypothetical protein
MQCKPGLDLLSSDLNGHGCGSAISLVFLFQLILSFCRLDPKAANPEQLAMQFASVAAANQQPKQLFDDKNNMMQSANNMNKRNNNMGINNNKANNMNLMVR